MEYGVGPMVVRNCGDIDRYLNQVRDAAGKIQAWVAAQHGDPLDLLRRMKFEPSGFHATLRGMPAQALCRFAIHGAISSRGNR